MKKKIGAALVLVFVLGICAKAAIFENFKTYGEIYTKGYYVNNIFDLDSGKAFDDDELRKAQTRITFGTMFDLIEDEVTANLTFVYGANSWNGLGTGIWGDPFMGTAGTNWTWPAGVGGLSGPPGQGVGRAGLLDSIEIAEANFVIHDLFWFDKVKLGRFYYGEPGDLVAYFGPRCTDDLWHDSITGVKADYVADLFDIDHEGYLVYGKTWELGLNDPLGVIGGFGVGDTDISIWGWRHWAHFSDMFHLGLQAYNGRTGTNGPGLFFGFANDTTLWVLGAKAKGEINGFDYYVEIIKNLGQGPKAPKTTKFTGYGLLAEAGYAGEIEGLGGLKPRGMFFYGSGDNKGLLASGTGEDKNLYVINSDFHPGEIFGKAGWLPMGNPVAFWSDLTPFGPFSPGWYVRSPFQFALANLQVWNLGIDWMPDFAERWTFMVDLYKFFINSSDTDGGGPGPATGGNHHIGAEVDLVAEYNHSENVKLKFVVARFWPESYLKWFYNPANLVNKLAAELIIKFGSKE